MYYILHADGSVTRGLITGGGVGGYKRQFTVSQFIINDKSMTNFLLTLKQELSCNNC